MVLIKPQPTTLWDNTMKTQATIKISTWYRDSTQEWVGEIEYQTEHVNGNARYTGKTENEARNAAFATVGYHIIETDWL